MSTNDVWARPDRVQAIVDRLSMEEEEHGKD